MYLFDFIGEAFHALVGMDQAGDGLTQVTAAVARQFTEFPIGVVIQIDLTIYQAPRIPELSNTR
jgi:hypothetical protein